MLLQDMDTDNDHEALFTTYEYRGSKYNTDTYQRVGGNELSVQGSTPRDSNTWLPFVVHDLLLKHIIFSFVLLLELSSHSMHETSRS